MRIGEFAKAVESYGVTCPANIQRGRTVPFYHDMLGLWDIGQGNRRDYTDRMVRRLVAWQLVQETTGLVANGNQHRRSPTSPLHRQAMRLLAAAPEGWVVMADGRAWWSLVAPVATFRSQCAVAIPVPVWRH